MAMEMEKGKDGKPANSMSIKNSSGYTENQKRLYERKYAIASKKAGKFLNKTQSEIRSFYADSKTNKKNYIPKKDAIANAKQTADSMRDSQYAKGSAKLVKKYNWSDSAVGSVASDVKSRGDRLAARADKRVSGSPVKGKRK